jgi:hypothetical protein
MTATTDSRVEDLVMFDDMIEGEGQRSQQDKPNQDKTSQVKSSQVKLTILSIKTAFLAGLS